MIECIVVARSAKWKLWDMAIIVLIASVLKPTLSDPLVVHLMIWKTW